MFFQRPEPIPVLKIVSLNRKRGVSVSQIPISLMRKILTILILCSCCVACSRYAYVEKPEHLLTEDQMVDILTQSALIQAASTLGAFRDGRIPPPEDAKAFYAALYAKYGIDQQIFEQNNLYYVDNVKEYIRIYTRVSDNLNEMLTDAQNREKILAERLKIEEFIRKLEKQILLQTAPGPQSLEQRQKRDSVYSVLPPRALEKEFQSRQKSSPSAADSTSSALSDTLSHRQTGSSRVPENRN